MRCSKNPQQTPPAQVHRTKILKWAKVHYQATGRWASNKDKLVLAAPEEIWHAVDSALAQGLRGLPGGSTLAKLLKKYRLK